MDNLKGFKRTCYAGDLKDSHIGEEVILMGWVQKKRNLGGLVFVDLRDREGMAQIVFDADVNKEAFEKAEKLGSEYVIAIKGKVFERQSKNPNMSTGDVEVFVEELRVLNSSQTPPIYIKDDDEVSEALRLKYRYLDLRKPKMQKNLMMRHKVASIVRNYLSENNFCEIETPFLVKPTPEGARDYLVPSRVNEGRFYALPQSPQLYKQLLMVSGMDRYFQIVKCFRDEDLRADRQPEFTQIDCEMSFVEEDDVMSIMEGLIKKVFKETLDKDIDLPLPRMTYADAMNKYGSDKPDTRYGLEFVNISRLVANCGFKVFSDATKPGYSVRGINVVDGAEAFTRKAISHLEDHAKTYKAKGLAWMKISEEGVTSPIAKFFSEDELNSIVKEMNAKPGDLLLFVADKDSVVFDSLGQVRIAVAEKLGLADANKFNLLWVTEFPIFEEDEENGRFVAKHHPFTSPMDEDLDKINGEDKLSLRAKAYDIVLNGYEIGGGSIRISDAEVQKKMFKALGFSDEEAYNKFGFLIDAFKFGTPPHGGIAFGMDRLVMLLAGADNIREVIAFPKNQNAVCPMTNAPSIAEDAQLKELSIKVDIQKD
ncbi:aspartate--tRNA ligase [Peptostreptococcus equinus]|uniref:Aspartate--tRNA ligase n=1 Tax=Peptostreptococcus equinus TaxID=3003601 RepID=A0ABY7JSX8_9FIRM|nr:aspartate--tRNA ligase [Peptostreptococcus sp. CBA3647]WAW15569.1 aspartate--tRNA ligase [Peptostreptococcus sp. CBA3647]